VTQAAEPDVDGGCFDYFSEGLASPWVFRSIKHGKIVARWICWFVGQDRLDQTLWVFY
jgi:hypothetical protein